jgi:lysophospholipase L1-like esterase
MRSLTQLFAASALVSLAACSSGQSTPDGEAGKGDAAPAGHVSDGGTDAKVPKDSGTPTPTPESDGGTPEQGMGQFTGPAAPQFAGRIDMSVPTAPVMAWSGSSITVRFRGTKAAVKLHQSDPDPMFGPNYISATLDGQPIPRFVLGSADSYSLAATVAAGQDHELTVVKESEAAVGTVTFNGFDFGDGSMILPSRAVTRRIEFIGDSITCGYGVLAANGDPMCGSFSQVEQVTKTFAADAANALGAQPTFIAFSGKGVYRNYDATTDLTMKDLYGLTSPLAAGDFDFTSAPQPDAVVVNLGTNDFAASTTANPPQSDFTAAYRALLGTVRQKHPNAVVVVTLGPMLSDTYPTGLMALSTARMYIQSVVTGLKDSKIVFFEFDPQDATMVACDFHPTAATQKAMGDALVGQLKTLLHW